MNTLLKHRWHGFCEDGGLDGQAEWVELSAAYGDPARAYHNLDHIADCLVRLDEHVHLAIDPVAVEFAIWFHDIVYDTHASDNEERSAVAAAGFLSATTHGAVVADLIRATRHDRHPCTADAALLCDIDLSILGRPPAVYDAYARAIRQEYEWVALPDFVKGRTRVLEAFLGRPSVFVLEEMEKIYGQHARVNLEREIRDLADLVAE
jgi:predicted metal-dependent HD superfamily phosphohydrolase